MNRHPGPVAATIVALIALVSCGDDDTGNPASPSSGATATADGVATTPEASTSEGSTPTSGDTTGAETAGEPIRVGISGPFESQSLNLPEVADAADAAIAAMNERGGVDGRPLELVTCNDAMNPDTAAQCGRQFAEDDSIVAVVGSTSILGQSFVPLLESAGIPDVGAYPTTPLHLTSPVVYPLQGGIFAAYAGSARLAVDNGHERIAVIYNDLPTAALVLDGIDSVLGPAGVEPVASLPVAVTTSDVAPAVQEIMRSDPDAVIVAFAQPLLSTMIQGFDQAGSDVPLFIASGDLSRDEILALGPAAEGVLGTSPLPPVTTEDPVDAIVRFNEEMDEYAPADAKRNAVALNAWAAVQLFVEAAGSAETIDRDGIRAAIEALDAYDSGGLTPPVDFTATPEIKPRLFNASVAPLTLGEGVYQYGGEFLDPYAS